MIEQRKTLEPAYFDALYATNPDPWNFETSPYERAKYALTLLAGAEAGGNGSIPAHAGQPEIASAPDGGVRVHPRACGAAVLTLSGPNFATGPSPRMRGSRF